jgi:hypothetical protein
MYPAFRCGLLMTAGPDGLRGLASLHCGALLCAMTERNVPAQVLTILPSLASCSLPVWARPARGLRRKRRARPIVFA